MNPLQSYLEANGILLCNRNPDLPALEDVGCTWQDMTKLIDRHKLFYSKAFRKRTTYLSPEAYYLLKAVKPQKPLTPSAERILSLLFFLSATFFSADYRGIHARTPLCRSRNLALRIMGIAIVDFLLLFFFVMVLTMYDTVLL